jgi:hypothetical protein
VAASSPEQQALFADTFFFFVITVIDIFFVSS